MRRVVFVTVVIAVLAGITGCGHPPVTPRTSDQVVAPSDQAAIYVAVVHRFLTTGESSFPGRFDVIYLLDYSETSTPTGGPSSTEPIAATDQAAVATGLRADAGRVEFVSDRDDVVTKVDGCAQVAPGGILITLGSLPDAAGLDPGRVEVSISGFVACLGAIWLTYVVERGADGWQATGTTGSVTIA